MLQRVAKLLRSQHRIERDQYHAGQRRAVLDDRPLGQVRRPQRDELPRLGQLQQTRRDPPRLLVQLGIAVAPGLPVVPGGDQCDGVRQLPGSLGQQRADRVPGQRDAPVGRPPRRGQRRL